jgi:hypothetical protein
MNKVHPIPCTCLFRFFLSGLATDRDHYDRLLGSQFHHNRLTNRLVVSLDIVPTTFLIYSFSIWIVCLKFEPLNHVVSVSFCCTGSYNQDGATKIASNTAGQKFVRLFLAKREVDGRKFENVQGEERKKLKKDLWPLLRPSLPAKYGNQNVPQYDEYITEILAQNRKITVQPNKTVTAHIASKRQAGNETGFSLANQRIKNQQINILLAMQTTRLTFKSTPKMDGNGLPTQLASQR